MTYYQLKCPNCNANLEVEDDLDTFFCKYCGTKIIVEGRSESVIKAKADIKLAEKEIEKQILKAQHEKEMQELNDKGLNQGLLICFGSIILIFILWFFI